MKKLIFIFSLIFSFHYLGVCQMCDNVSVWHSDNIKLGENKLCKERGHIQPNTVTSTLMHCPDYLIETDSISYIVTPGCNTIYYRCLRCGKEIEDKQKEIKTIIWKKN